MKYVMILRSLLEKAETQLPTRNTSIASLLEVAVLFFHREGYFFGVVRHQKNKVISLPTGDATRQQILNIQVDIKTSAQPSSPSGYFGSFLYCIIAINAS